MTEIKVTFHDNKGVTIQSESIEDNYEELGKLLVRAFQFSNPVFVTLVRNSNLCNTLAAQGKAGGAEIDIGKRGDPVPEFTIPLSIAGMKSLKEWQIKTGQKA